MIQTGIDVESTAILIFDEKPMNYRICELLINSSPITKYVRSKSMERICKIREFCDKEENSFDFPPTHFSLFVSSLFRYGEKIELLLKKGFWLYVKMMRMLDSKRCRLSFSCGESNPWSVGLS